jgi:hypothetical protein
MRSILIVALLVCHPSVVAAQKSYVADSTVADLRREVRQMNGAIPEAGDAYLVGVARGAMIYASGFFTCSNPGTVAELAYYLMVLAEPTWTVQKAMYREHTLRGCTLSPGIIEYLRRQ